MQEWLAWARGPLFRFAIVLLALGILRLVLLNVVALWDASRRAGDKRIPIRRVIGDSLVWLLPFARVPTQKLPVTAASIVFHAAVIVTPLFLGAHIMLWHRGVGLTWPAMPQVLADHLTLAGLAAGLVLLWHRVFRRAARALSRPQDYGLLVLLLVTSAAGYLAMHPSLNPFLYDSTMLVHVLTGDAALIALPYSKLSHAVVFPFNQLAAELGWHLVPGAGRRVAAALHKENEPI
jgi:hypothetical protein